MNRVKTEGDIELRSSGGSRKKPKVFIPKIKIDLNGENMT